MRDSDVGLKGYMDQVGNHPILSKDQEVDLFQRYEAGDDTARDEIVRCNLRLVISIANQFAGRGYPLEDMIQEGNIGLLEVIDKFDWRRGFRFSTYAAFWIRQSIQQALRKQANLIRLPVRKSRMLGTLNEAITRVQNDTFRDPTTEELAEEMDVSVDNMRQLLRAREGVLSLDEERDEGLSLRDSIPAPQDNSPVERLSEEQRHECVEDVLEYLTERERQVLRLRFGFDSGESMSLRGASAVIGLSQEGVRRIEQKALDKLRRPAISAKVADLL